MFSSSILLLSTSLSTLLISLCLPTARAATLVNHEDQFDALLAVYDQLMGFNTHSRYPRFALEENCIEHGDGEDADNTVLKCNGDAGVVYL